MSGCCRIDPIHHGGIYIPLLAPVFRCLPSPLSFFLSFPWTSVSSSPAALSPGWFLPCDRLCRHFPGGACASSLSLPFPSCRHPVFATTRTPSLPSPLVVSLEDATAIVYASNLLTPRRNDTPPEVVAWSGRLHDFWNF